MAYFKSILLKRSNMAGWSFMADDSNGRCAFRTVIFQIHNIDCLSNYSDTCKNYIYI